MLYDIKIIVLLQKPCVEVLCLSNQKKYKIKEKEKKKRTTFGVVFLAHVRLEKKKLLYRFGGKYLRNKWRQTIFWYILLDFWAEV